MDATNDVGAGEQQQVVVAFQVARVVAEAFAAIVGLLQVVALNHRAHGAVENQQALL